MRLNITMIHKVNLKATECCLDNVLSQLLLALSRQRIVSAAAGVV